MKEKIISKTSFKKTVWSGGETTQLAIYPEDSIFSEKDFLFRISSATFTSTESQFSNFSGYQRYILPLEGKLYLSHEGLYHRDLNKYDAEYFDGSWTTFSKNTLDCIDYNFIVKSGYQANMKILKENDEYEVKGSAIVSIFSVENFEIELDAQANKKEITGFSLYLLETEADEKQLLKITGCTAPVIITEFITKF